MVSCTWICMSHRPGIRKLPWASIASGSAASDDWAGDIDAMRSSWMRTVWSLSSDPVTTSMTVTWVMTESAAGCSAVPMQAEKVSERINVFTCPPEAEGIYPMDALCRSDVSRRLTFACAPATLRGDLPDFRRQAAGDVIAILDDGHAHALFFGNAARACVINSLGYAE
jgi:hypothetical protein